MILPRRRNSKVIRLIPHTVSITNLVTDNAESSTTSLFPSLPAEIHLAIIERAHPCTSVCLGLTCKSLYAMHKAVHPHVSLLSYWDTKADLGHLYELLNTWMGPNLTYRWTSGKFLTAKTWEGMVWGRNGKGIWARSGEENETRLRAEWFKRRYAKEFGGTEQETREILRHGLDVSDDGFFTLN